MTPSDAHILIRYPFLLSFPVRQMMFCFGFFFFFFCSFVGVCGVLLNSKLAFALAQSHYQQENLAIIPNRMYISLFLGLFSFLLCPLYIYEDSIDLLG